MDRGLSRWGWGWVCEWVGGGVGPTATTSCRACPGFGGEGNVMVTAQVNLYPKNIVRLSLFECRPVVRCKDRSSSRIQTFNPLIVLISMSAIQPIGPAWVHLHAPAPMNSPPSDRQGQFPNLVQCLWHSCQSNQSQW